MESVSMVAAWQRVRELAKALEATPDDRKISNSLHLAILGYAEACGYELTGRASLQMTQTSRGGSGGRSRRSGKTVPFGRSKGLPIEEATTKDLTWLAEVLRESIDEPAREKYREQNAALLSAIEAELESR